MKLKAKIKWSGEDVLVKPVFFSWNVGLQYKTIVGHGADSMFCNKEENYTFPTRTKIILLFIKFLYWVKMWLWMQLRYWQPRRIKQKLTRQNKSELPF